MNELPADVTDETNKVTSIDNDDDNEGSEISGNYATSSQNDQNSISDNLMPEGEGFQNESSNSEEDSQSGPDGQRNQGSSPSLTSETAEHPPVDISNEIDISANEDTQPHDTSESILASNRSEDSSRQSIESTATSIRPQRQRRAARNIEFLEI